MVKMAKVYYICRLKMELTPDIISKFNSRTIEENILDLVEVYGEEGVFSTSFGLEDQAITHILASG
jgi:hypothetical protein